jgi:hypothetical protein
MIGVDFGRPGPVRGLRFGPQRSRYAANAPADFRFTDVLARVNYAQVSAPDAVASAFTRGSGRYGEDASGVLVPFAAGEPAIQSGIGYRHTEGWTNMVTDPLASGAVVGFVGSGGSLPNGNGTGHIDTVEVLSVEARSDGLTWVTVSLTTNAVASVTYPRLWFVTNVASTAGDDWSARVKLNLISHSGAAAPVQAQLEGSSDFKTLDLFNFAMGEQEVFLSGQNDGTSTLVKFQFGVNLAIGESWSCIIEYALPQLTKTAYQMPPGTGTTVADKMIFDAGAVGFGVNPSVSGFTVLWRGTLRESAANYARAFEVASDIDNRLALAKNASDQLTILYAVGGVYGSAGLVAGLGEETTVGVSWRADGSMTIAEAGQAQVTRTAAPFDAAVSTLSAGCGRTGADLFNGETGRLLCIPSAIGDDDLAALVRRAAA